ncbi:MAG TPA: endonuclease/exonuclease/phosphatase family protein [Candidatus Limnocylindria bacterium]|nr:endonuclease/exonuclease/phosphatase family protein [Candidatus Limnocylindria bacterium]
MIGEVTFGVIGLLFLFADLRTFTSTFQQTFFGAPNTNLAAMAIAVFSTSFLGVLVAARLRPRRAVGTSAALFGLATGLLTVSRNNWLDLALSIVALASGLWWLALLHGSRVSDAAPTLSRALPIAFVVDLALRSALRTVAVPDLAWPVAVGSAVAALLLFGAAGIATLSSDRQWTAPGLLGTVALIAVPSLVLVAETGGTNGAQIAAAAGLGFGPEPPRATQIGQVVAGLGLAAGALALVRFGTQRFLAVVALAGGAALLWSHQPFLSLVGGFVLAAGLVLASSVLLASPQLPARAPTVTVLALAIGWLVFVVTAFGFYAYWAYEPAVWAATAIVAAGVIVAAAPILRLGRPLAIVAVALAVAAPLGAFLTTPVPPDPEPPRVTFRLMTYNVHQGFSAGQIPSLDDLVDTIAREAPDVLVLQEVVRGWMIDEDHDVLSVLAERLGMQYAFIANIGDLYGNAVLSRFPMTEVRRVGFAREASLKHQPRGALFVRTANVLVVVTHLDEVSDGTFVRQDQVRTILREWNGESPAIVAGDLNAKPEDIEIRLFDQAGFLDLGQSAGSTTTGSEDKRIDYVWGIGVVGSQAHTVLATNASDHRALVVNVTITK